MRKFKIKKFLRIKILLILFLLVSFSVYTDVFAVSIIKTNNSNDLTLSSLTAAVGNVWESYIKLVDSISNSIFGVNTNSTLQMTSQAEKQPEQTVIPTKPSNMFSNVVPISEQIIKAGLVGQMGPQGPKGNTGPKGLKGDKGDKGESGSSSIDTSSFVLKSFLSAQVDRIFDSMGRSTQGLSDLLSERVDTDLLTVSGNATIGGNITITGNITGNVVGTINPSFTLGSIPFQGASGLTENNTNLFWDSTNSRLGIGTITPTEKLNVVGNILSTGTILGSNLSGTNTGDNAVNSLYSGLATSKQDALSGTGFVKITGTTISYDNSTYLTSLDGAAILTSSNTFTQINPLITPAESWIGPSSTSGTYFKNGNVGIGTTDPGAKLSIAAGAYGVNSEEIRFQRNDNSARYNSIYSNSETGGLASISFRVHDAVTTTSQATVMTLLGNGNVGIGTTAPTHTLEVNGSIYSSDISIGGVNPGSMTLNANGITNGGVITTYGKAATDTITDIYNATLDRSAGNGGVGLGLGYTYSLENGAGNRVLVGRYKYAWGVPTAGAETSNFTIQNISAGTLVDALTIQGGNVGIGTTAPGYQLTVNGVPNIHTSGDTDRTNIFVSDTSNVAAGVGGGISFGAYYDVAKTIQLPYAYINGVRESALNADNSGNLIFGVRQAGSQTKEALRIISSGNVGIGTGNPTYKLDVKGTAATDGIRSDMGFDIYPVPDPTAPTGAVSSGGSVDTGTHWYAVTYTTALGETHPTYTATQVTTTAGNNTVTLTIPTSSDPRVTGRKIYRTKVGASQWGEYLLATIGNNTETTYPDSAADSTLSGSSGIAYFRTNTTTKGITVGGTKYLTLDSKGTFVGLNTGANLTTGGRNVFLGQLAGAHATTTNDTIAIGENAGGAAMTGTTNIFIGSYSGQADTSGARNIGLGYGTLYANTTGTNNTAIGNLAGYIQVGVSNNIFLGYEAGRYETAGNKLIIDSLDRTNEETARSSALIYGVVNSTPASQTLSLGGGGNVGIGTTNPNRPLQIVSSSNTISTMLKVHNTFGTGTAGASLLLGTSGTENNETVGVLLMANRTDALAGGDTDLLFKNSNGTTLNTNMAIKASGNVGIGTTNPIAALQVIGGINASSTIWASRFAINGYGSSLSDSSDGIILLTNAALNNFTRLNLGPETSAFPALAVNGSDLQVIRADGSTNANLLVTGNVGIGTTNPGQVLDVIGSIRGYDLVTKNGYVFRSENNAYLRAAGASINIADNNTANVLMAAGGGNVGIGTTSPQGKLDVAVTGVINETSGGNIRTGGVIIGTPGTGGSLFVNTPGFSATYNAGLGIDGVYTTPGSDGLALVRLTAYGSRTSVPIGRGELAFQTTSIAGTVSERMRITSAGNVGIGTTSPGSLLHVNGGILVGAAPTGGDKGIGTINISGDIYKNNTAYTNPDYVFEKFFTGEIVKFASNTGASTYEGLKPLSDIKQFISENYELPIIFRTDGGLFGKGDALLASLEETYLYLFDHEQRIEELNLKLEDLSSLDITSDVSIGSLIKNFLADIGNGIEKVFVKTVVTEGIEMKDSETGETYCVIITNGEFEKIKGECGEPIVPAQTQTASAGGASDDEPTGTCTDNIKNQDETDIDTGGICDVPPQADSTCSDGILNQDETAIDEGGVCTKTEPTCADGILNQDEAEIDKGGVCGPIEEPSCTDGVMNQDETAVDTGGICTPA